MKMFECIECNHKYQEHEVPDSHVCELDTCPGNKLTGLIIEVSNSNAGSNPTTGTNTFSNQIKEIGLCVLLMDGSGSMFFEHAFEGQNLPSTFGAEFLNKAEMVAKCAANAIFQLKDISLKGHQDAYILAIKFDHRQEIMFHKPIKELVKDYPDAQAFARHIYDELFAMQGGTNINGALNMAYSFIEKFKQGNIPGIGDFEPMFDSIYLPNKGGDYEIPNIRAMIYTDGEQLDDYGDIVNPFRADDPDLLLGAYIGSQSEAGCQDLKKIIGSCPIHGQQQFFLIDNPRSQATLRRLFRMASDASGFCPTCIPPSELR